LVGAGFAVFEVEFVVVVVVEVLPDFGASFEVEFEAAVFEVVVDDVFDGADVLVVVVVVVVVVDVFEFAVVVLDLFAGALLAVSPPQATPNAAKPKSAESAIAFFILKTVSYLLKD
jgi:hypothetical protein